MRFIGNGNRWYTKSGPSATYVNKRNIPSVRQGKAYEDDVIPGGEAEADQESVDLHKGEFCVDVSTFGPVQYDITPVEVCDSTFSKKCEDRYETVITPQILALTLHPIIKSPFSI